MFKDILNFLKTISIRNPNANSKPASPKIKKVLENIFKSSKYTPRKTEYVYKTIQVVSEKRNKNKKLE